MHDTISIIQHNAFFFTISIIGAYSIGAIPFGYIIARIIYNINPLHHGSNNVGATNITRLCGKAAGACTLILDSSKAAITAYIIYITFNNMDIAFIGGFIAIVGHTRSVFIKFKGGKGVASAYGVALCLIPYVGVWGLSVWLIIFAIGRVSSLSALISWLTMPFMAYFLYDNSYYALYIGLYSTYIFILHHSNIKRLLARNEHGFKK